MARGGRIIEVKVVGDASDLKRSLRGSSAALKGFGKDADRAGGRGQKLKGGLLAVGKGAGVAGAAFGGGLAIGLKKAVAEFGEAQKVAAQTNAVLKSTKGVANVTAKQVDSLADSISRKTGMDDEAIASAQNLLLTFKNVRNEAGRGNVFARSTRAAVDLSAAMQAAGKSMSISDATLQLGKALQDPERGMTRLMRSGVDFTQGQKDQVAALVASGETLKAQKVILREVESQFKGSAEAAGNTLPGALNKANVALGNFGEVIGAKVAPLITTAASRFAQFIREVQAGTGAGGRFRDTMASIASTVGAFVAPIASVTGKVAQFGAAFVQTQAGMIALGGIIGGLVGRLAFLGAAWAVGKAVAFVGAIKAATTAVRALSVASAGTVIGALALVIGTVVGAMAGMKASTDRAKVSARGFTDALRNQADALRAVRDIDLDVAQRKANLKSANVAVAASERRLADLRNAGKGKALEGKQAEADLRQARINQKRATRDLGDAESDSRRKREDSTRATQDANAKARGRIGTLRNEIKTMGWLKEKFEGNSRAVRGFTTRQRELRLEISKLKSKEITVKVKMTFDDVATGASKIAPGVGGPGLQEEILSGARGAARKVASKYRPRGPQGLPGSQGGGAPRGGSIVALGRWMQSRGYQVGEHPAFGGVAPGVHSPGGYHYKARALDVNADGRAGGEPLWLDRLYPILQRMNPTELLWRVADHFDHLHVAFKKGGKVPGQGSGDRVPAMLEPGEHVIRKSVASKIRPLLDQLNVQRFAHGGAVSGPGGIPGEDWHTAARVGRKVGVDPKLLVAIGLHETGWGKLGDGRKGNILGFGSFDGGSSYKWAGVHKQLVGAAKLLKSWGATTIGAVRAGKAGPYATDPGWESKVGAWYNKIKGWKGGSGGSGGGSGGGGGGGQKDMDPGRKGVQTLTPAERKERTPAHGRSGISLDEAIDLSRNRVTGAEGTKRTSDDVSAIKGLSKNLAKKAKALRARLAKINKALKGKLTPGVRERLLGERSGLFGDLGSISGERIGLRGQVKQIGTDKADAAKEVADAFAAYKADLTEFMKSLKAQLGDLASQAASAWRAGIEKGIDSTLKSRLAAIAGNSDSSALNAILGRQSGREDRQNKRDLERAKRRLALGRAGGASPRRLDELEAGVDEVQARILEKRIAAQTDAANKEADAAREGLDQQEEDLRVSLSGQLGTLFANLENRKTMYRDFVQSVRAILGPFGVDFEGGEDPSPPGADITRARGGRPGEANFSGFAHGGTVRSGETVLVGERGPELATFPRGAQVHSNAESKRLVGHGAYIENMTINTTGRVDHERIAQRLAFKIAHA